MQCIIRYIFRLVDLILNILKFKFDILESWIFQRCNLPLEFQRNCKKNHPHNPNLHHENPIISHRVIIPSIHYLLKDYTSRRRSRSQFHKTLVINAHPFVINPSVPPPVGDSQCSTERQQTIGGGEMVLQRNRGRRTLWELAISQGDSFAHLGDPPRRGCVPSLSIGDVCMRSRPVAIVVHTRPPSSQVANQLLRRSPSYFPMNIWIEPTCSYMDTHEQLVLLGLRWSYVSVARRSRPRFFPWR